MPAPIAHITLGYSLFRIIRHYSKPVALTTYFGNQRILLVACLFFSMLPDADSALGILCGDFGRYHNQWSHSLLFGLIPSTLVFVLVATVFTHQSASRWTLLCLGSYALHVLLDFFCYGRGVMLFWPLTSQRYISPFLLFYGVRWSDGFISAHHIETIITELLFALVLLPLVCWLTPQKISRGR